MRLQNLVLPQRVALNVVLALPWRPKVLSSASPCALGGVASETPPQELSPEPWVLRSSRIHGIGPKGELNARTHGTVIDAPGWYPFPFPCSKG